MLTRLKVCGFKNLVDVDVRFGAFTCIAGVNGVGKSNLFDAIRFLSLLAQYPLTEAALKVRDGSTTADIRSLFHHDGNDYADKMSFEAEMIISKEGVDNFGQKIKARETLLRYFLELTYKQDNDLRSLNKLEIVKEDLTEINTIASNQYLLLRNIAKTNNQSSPILEEKKLIYTKINEKGESQIFLAFIPDVIKNKSPLIADNLPETSLLLVKNFLYSINTETLDKVKLVRLEMSLWQLLQLETSSLRNPNDFIAPAKIETNGANLASALYNLVDNFIDEYNTSTVEEIETRLYSQVGNRLSELIEDVNRVWVDRDDARQLLTLMVEKRDGTVHSARSLSDGTLRFLALIILELDPDSLRLLCLEEPENGIHPERIVSVLRLLQDIAVDPEYPVDFDNPLRQVIINTHSPVVVQQVPDDSLLVAELKNTMVDGKKFQRACFSYLPDTWRDNKDKPEKSNIISKGKLLSYLNPVPLQDGQDRLIDRPDLQRLIPGADSD